MNTDRVALSEYLEGINNGNKWVMACRRCGHVYCDWSQNPKEFAKIVEEPLTKAGRLHSDSDRFIFRQFFCPECATLFATDVAAKGSPILWEIRLEQRRR